MAIANAIAGIKAGATYVNTTINGLGERAGNAAFEELVMALKYVEGVDLGFNTNHFRNLSEYVARASNRVLPTWKPIVGGNLFVYEDENKVKGVIADPTTYELFKEKDVGLERQYVPGKYSGATSIIKKMDMLGVKIDKKQAEDLAEIIRKKTVSSKRSLFDSEILDTYKEYTGKSKKAKTGKGKGK
jgi:homocitrate synthase NifV